MGFLDLYEDENEQPESQKKESEVNQKGKAGGEANREEEETKEGE
jgi:hypothetical protein